MFRKKFGSLVVVSSIVFAVGVACSDNDANEDEGAGGSSGAGGKGNAAAGSSAKAGSAGSGQGGTATAGSGGSVNPSGGSAGQHAAAGEGGSEAGGVGGEANETGGQGGQAVDGGAGGAGGSGGESALSCEETRAALLGPINSVSAGLVEITSDANAALVTLRIDASAGGFVAAATNPYIYFNLASKAAVAVTDVAADTSTAWDIALKRDNIRSNGGDSGPGNAQVAVLTGVDFANVTPGAATNAAFGQDQFVDPVTCAGVRDGFDKPLTRFGEWYDYNPTQMTLAPAAKVYLVRAANGTSLYKLQITGYYVDVPNGQGGTVKKSAVYSLQYQALQ